METGEYACSWKPGTSLSCHSPQITMILHQCRVRTLITVMTYQMSKSQWPLCFLNTSCWLPLGLPHLHSAPYNRMHFLWDICMTHSRISHRSLTQQNFLLGRWNPFIPSCPCHLSDFRSFLYLYHLPCYHLFTLSSVSPPTWFTLYNSREVFTFCFFSMLDTSN